MNLSMWILIDWLNEDVKQSVCTSGKMVINSVRLFSKDQPCRNDILYIGSGDNFFGDGSENIVCKNQDDYIILNSTDLYSCVNKVQDAFCYFRDWDTNCHKVIFENRSLDDLLEMSNEPFPSPIIIVDAAQTFVAISQKNADFQNSEEWKLAQERGSVSESYLRKYNLAHPEVYNQRHVFQVDPEYFFVKGYCKHLFIDGARRASVILKVTGEDYSKGKIQLFDYYTEIIKEWINSSGENGTKFHVRSYFAKALEGDPEAISAMIRQTVLFGWDEKCLKLLFLIKPMGEASSLDTQIVANITNEAEGRYAMIYKGMLTILINSSIIQHPTFNSNLDRLLKSRKMCGAVSFAFTDMKLITQAYLISLSTLEHNPPVAGVLYHSQDTSLRRIAKILNEQASSTLNHPILQMLKNYDIANKTDYYNTLFSYLKNERRQQATAEELFIHRNTLTQRLTKIQEICPIDYENADERFHILFSFYKQAYGE